MRFFIRYSLGRAGAAHTVHAAPGPASALDGGRSFSAPLNLSASRAGDGKERLDRTTWSNGSLDIAASADGSVHAAWTDYEGACGWRARATVDAVSARRSGSRATMPIRRVPPRQPPAPMAASIWPGPSARTPMPTSVLRTGIDGRCWSARREHAPMRPASPWTAMAGCIWSTWNSAGSPRPRSGTRARAAILPSARRAAFVALSMAAPGSPVPPLSRTAQTAGNAAAASKACPARSWPPAVTGSRWSTAAWRRAAPAGYGCCAGAWRRISRSRTMRSVDEMDLVRSLRRERLQAAPSAFCCVRNAYLRDSLIDRRPRDVVPG